MTQVDEQKTDGGDGHVNGVTGTSKTTFSPEQQEKVQELIDEAYRKAYTKAQRGTSTSEEVEKLKGEVERLRDDQLMSGLLRVISRHNVVDAEEVAELVKDQVRVGDDGGLTVVGRSGSTRIDSSGRAMGLEEYIGRWLSERPHHLRASGSSGSGSGGARFGGDHVATHNLTDPSAWRQMPREDLDRLLREGVNVQGAAGQTYRFKDVKNPFIEAKRKRLKNREHNERPAARA